MGSATEICTDKTGTLTENKMKVMQYYTNDTVQDAAANPGDNKINSIVIESLIYNCSAHQEVDSHGNKVAKGNPTEVGILTFLMQ